jgi:hypothetical protein
VVARTGGVDGEEVAFAQVHAALDLAGLRHGRERVRLGERLRREVDGQAAAPRDGRHVRVRIAGPPQALAHAPPHGRGLPPSALRAPASARLHRNHRDDLAVARVAGVRSRDANRPLAVVAVGCDEGEPAAAMEQTHPEVAAPLDDLQDLRAPALGTAEGRGRHAITGSSISRIRHAPRRAGVVRQRASTRRRVEDTLDEPVAPGPAIAPADALDATLRLQLLQHAPDAAQRAAAERQRRHQRGRTLGRPTAAAECGEHALRRDRVPRAVARPAPAPLRSPAARCAPSSALPACHAVRV